MVELIPGNEEQFVIMSSDGVWEFIPSQEAVDFVARAHKNGVQTAAGIFALFVLKLGHLAFLCYYHAVGKIVCAVQSCSL